MLYGDFRECEPCVKKGEVLRVKLDYGGEVLRLLVEFCFTDRLDSLNNSRDSEMEEETSSSSRDGSNEDNSQVTDDAKDEPVSLSRTARLLTSLSSAAHYFDIPRLEHDILSRLDEVMTAHPSLACVVLDEGSKIMSAEELCTVALERIRARPKAALLPCNTNEACTDIFDGEIHNGELLGGVTALSATLLERVVFDETTSASELTKFTCLQRWVEGCTHPVVTELNEVPSDEDGEENDNNNPSSHPTPTPKSHKQSHMEQKRSIAAHLAQKLDLSLIPASDLDTVSHSNLLSQDDLFKAYRLQALNAERTKSKVFVEYPCTIRKDCGKTERKCSESSCAPIRMAINPGVFRLYPREKNPVKPPMWIFTNAPCSMGVRVGFRGRMVLVRMGWVWCRRGGGSWLILDSLRHLNAV